MVDSESESVAVEPGADNAVVLPAVRGESLLRGNAVNRCQHGFRPGTCAECERQSREAVGDYLHEKAERERAERLQLRREIADRRPDLDGLP